jgi:hypothetical protein
MTRISRITVLLLQALVMAVQVVLFPRLNFINFTLAPNVFELLSSSFNPALSGMRVTLRYYSIKTIVIKFFLKLSPSWYFRNDRLCRKTL